MTDIGWQLGYALTGTLVTFVAVLRIGLTMFDFFGIRSR